MKQRTITAIVAGAGFLAVLFIGGVVYSALIFVIATLAYREFCHMARRHFFNIECIIGLLYVWSIFFKVTYPNVLPNISLFPLTVGFLIAWLIWTVVSGNKPSIHTVSVLFVGSLYIGAGFAFMAATRFLPEGFILSLFVIIMIWTSDSSAYLAGRKFGKRKLWPVISPNKTIFGSVAAIIFSAIVGMLFWGIAGGPFSFSHTLILAVIVSIVGQLGDLVESALKRSLHVKDSGNILPGHGGVFDRFDSLIFTFAFLNIFQFM